MAHLRADSMDVPFPNGARRKRGHDDFEPHPSVVFAFDNGGAGSAERRSEGGESNRRSSLIGIEHGGFQVTNIIKSRRVVNEVNHGAHLEEPLGTNREVFAPPGPPVLMSEPLQKATVPNPFVPTASGVASFSTSQLDGFRLEPVTLEHKENKSRVLKPVAKRTLPGGPHSTPRLQPSQLPGLSQFLSPADLARTGPSIQPQPNFPAFNKAFLGGSRPFGSWRAPSTTVLHNDGGLPPPTKSAPSTPAITASVDPPIKSEVGIAFSAADSDQCSSDEEFSMENEISLSQDKLNNLSVHDIPDHLLHEEEDRTPHVLMQLAPGFASMLSEQEEKKLKEMGAYSVVLKVSPDPIILGRDHFYPVFGDKIRGCETFHLSRRHCVFHVSRNDSKTSSKQYKVIVENTSTNGLDVNGRPMKNLEQRELHVGDTVTLLKIRNHSGDISLAYTLLIENPAPAQAKLKTSMTPSRRSPRIARNRAAASKLHLARKPKSTGSTNPFALPFSPPRKKMKFPTIRIDFLIADPFIAVSESPRQQSRGYRDELSATMAAFAPVERLVVTYECATKEALFAAVQNSKHVFFYAGGMESNKILVEDATGRPTYVDMQELSAAVGEEGSKPEMAIVFAKSVETAQAFVDAGIPRVIFVNSSTRLRSKAIGYLRSLLACLLKGSTIGEGHAQARRAALGEVNSPSTMSDCLCGILPGGVSHDINVGELPKRLDSRARASLANLNALLIPSLPPYFLPQEEVIGEVIGALRKSKVQVCSLQGGKGVGKTSTSVYVAKYATDRGWYKDGVHYFDVESAFTNGKDTSSSSPLGWTDDPADSDDKRQRVTRRVQNEIDELLQLLHPKVTTDTSNSTLVVLDGCDRLCVAQFRDFIVNTVQAYPTVQILITMRQFMTINIHSKIIEESTIQLKELSANDTATVFLSMAKACLDQERLSKALPSLVHDVIAKHPALTRLNGNPLLLSRLAVELRTTKLDELQ